MIQLVLIEKHVSKKIVNENEGWLIASSTQIRFWSIWHEKLALFRRYLTGIPIASEYSTSLVLNN